MRQVLKLLALVAVGISLARSAPAVPITGTLSFGGTARLDGTTVENSGKVVGWGPVNPVSDASGSFSSLTGHSVSLTAPWSFYSGFASDFWNVGGFRFDLSSSTVFDGYGGVLTILLAGTVTSTTYDSTAFLGRVKIFDPATTGGDFKYTESLDFATTPDGGTTALLLGLTLSVFAFLRRKSPAA